MKVLTGIGLVALLMTAVMLPWSLTDAQTTRSVGETIELARTNLFDQQNPDGSIGDFGTSGWAAIALQASGAPSTEGRFAKLKNYLNEASSRVDKTSATELERTILSLVAIGSNPYNIAGRDLVEELKALANAGQIGSPNLLNDDIFAILAFKATGQDPASEPFRSAIEFVKRNQLANGGFNDRVGAGEMDIDTTAVAILALSQFADATSAKSLLASSQNADGGFPSRVGSSSNVASTSWVSWAIGLNQAMLDYLTSQQQTNGSFGSLLITSYVLHALSGRNLPIGFVSAPSERAAEVSQTTTQTVTLAPEATSPTPTPATAAQPSNQQTATTQPRRSTTRRAQQPTRVDQPSLKLRPASQSPSQTIPSTFLIAGSYPSESITQFVTAPKTVELPQIKPRPAPTSPTVLVLLIVLTTLSLTNTLSLLALWRKVSARAIDQARSVPLP